MIASRKLEVGVEWEQQINWGIVKVPVDVCIHRKGGLFEGNCHDNAGSFMPHPCQLLQLWKSVWNLPIVSLNQSLQVST